MSEPVWIKEVYTPPKYTKYCFVTSCKNDSLKTPDKHYFHVPQKNKAEWCRAVGKTFIPKGPLFICEDHLDLEHDLENYEKWIIFKGNAKLRPSVPFLKKISMPTETITQDEAGPSTLSKEKCVEKCKPFEDKSIACAPITAIKSTQYYILADRGFKHLETILSKKSIRLLRPPSVFSDKKLTKAEVIQAKLIASLRVHIERVIRRVRVFKFLKPHSVINNKCTAFLDNAVIIACGAINLQSPIIKKE